MGYGWAFLSAGLTVSLLTCLALRKTMEKTELRIYTNLFKITLTFSLPISMWLRQSHKNNWNMC